MTQVKEKPARSRVATAVDKTLAKDPKTILAGMTQGLHTWHSGEGTTTYQYSDEDVTAAIAVYSAVKAGEEAVSRFATILVRIFGDAWTKEDAGEDAKKPLRQWLREILPEAREVHLRAVRYGAAIKAGGAVDVTEATAIKMLRRGTEGRITRILRGGAKAWLEHIEAQDPEFNPERKAKKTRNVEVLLDDFVASLEKRASKGAADASTATRCAALIRQLPERLGLFEAVMKAGARVKAKDDVLIEYLGKLETL